jgi:hypothetical protein
LQFIKPGTRAAGVVVPVLVPESEIEPDIQPVVLLKPFDSRVGESADVSWWVGVALGSIAARFAVVSRLLGLLALTNGRPVTGRFRFWLLGSNGEGSNDGQQDDAAVEDVFRSLAAVSEMEFA